MHESLCGASFHWLLVVSKYGKLVVVSAYTFLWCSGRELCSAADQILLSPVQDLDPDSRMAWLSNLDLEWASSTLGLRI